MRLNSGAFAAACGILWSFCVLFLGIADMIWPGYGRAILDICASIYPGYHPGTGFGSVIVGTLYALVDGLVGGAILGWLYNRLAGE
jgi:hypothetical protein